MTPGARAQAAAELLDQIVAAAREGGAAADTLIARYFKTRRYAGSHDRRAVRELVYRAIRAWPEPPPSGREAIEGREPSEGAIMPAWLSQRLDPLVEAGEHGALLDRAPLDLRVNRLKAKRDELLGAFAGAAPTPHSPIGLRLPEGTRVEASDAWAVGLVEVQDEGSQLLSLACGVAPGMVAVDLCAGAGGKTLALAAEMEDRGRLLACDTDRARLSRLRPRLQRSGASIVETRLLDPGREREALADLAGAADLVLVDAPCSGTGTWRRNPEARWRLTSERLGRLVKLQAHLLDTASELVRPGGILVYAVCSLLAEEGRDQAVALTGRSALVPEPPAMAAGRASGPGLMLTPGHDGTDGFFIARWRAPC
jgi:16S rRNA (cytosine967-C5)-methyltransferase